MGACVGLQCVLAQAKRFSQDIWFLFGKYKVLSSHSVVGVLFHFGQRASYLDVVEVRPSCESTSLVSNVIVSV